MGDDTLMMLSRAAATAPNQPFGHQGKQPIYWSCTQTTILFLTFSTVIQQISWDSHILLKTGFLLDDFSEK